VFNRLKQFLLVFALTCLFAVTGCGSAQSNNSSFNFIFKYGVQAGNVLDTFKGKYTRDMVRGSDATTRLTLTQDELNQIHAKMDEIDFWNYPDNFEVAPTGNLVSIVTPFNSYYFRVQNGNVIKELKWDDEITNPDVQADKLRDLIMLITGIIRSKPAYQRLPEPRAAYL
jgi:hypothetical protein